MTASTMEMDRVQVNKRVGLEIKAWLARRELRQVDIAQALGLSQGAVSQRLMGRVSFSVEELLAVAGLLEITLADLLGSGLLNAQGPRPATQDEGLQKLPRLDSNQQPFD
ncbi:helix-turn-helix transcriptional regulator [Micrococcus terreus]|uniref:helix-turn-helix domain-containing protein n=1 Tax=Micrococcus terreus TaxID=574650 RepID=UPI0033D53B59